MNGILLPVVDPETATSAAVVALDTTMEHFVVEVLALVEEC